MKYKILFSPLLIFSLASCTTPTTPLSATSVANIQRTVSSDENTDINVYKAVVQEVVSIETVQTATTTSTRRTASVPTQQSVTGTGSGVTISKNGYIVTNNHVIANSSKITVTLKDNSQWPAKLIETDKDKDIAIIKIEAPQSSLTAATLGDSSNISVGQKVLAIGNPYGLQGTLTTGIISSLNRDLASEDGTQLKNIIQTDAAINPGNSGGPLLNSFGEIIGINTAIFSTNGGNVGIGFAISVNDIKSLVQKYV